MSAAERLLQKQPPLRAAVFDANDPRASTVAKIVPPNAKISKVGYAVEGYWHDPNASRRSGDRTYDRALGRIREIEVIIRHLFGSHIPDPRGTDDYDTCVAYIRQAAFALVKGQEMTAWCRKWAPWADAVLISEIEAAASNRRQRTDRTTKADDCGKDICLTWALRCELSIKTIAAFDMTAKEAEIAARERKRERDRTRQEQKRKEEGMKDRQSYVAESLSQSKPWEAEGICRRTWERRRVASLSRVQSKTVNGDTLATTVQKAAQPVPPVPSLHSDKANVGDVPQRPDAASLRSNPVGVRGRSSPPALDNVDAGTTFHRKAG